MNQNFTNNNTCLLLTNKSDQRVCHAVYYYRQAINSQPALCNRLPTVPNSTILYNMVYYTNKNLSDIYNTYIYSYYNITPYGYCVSNIAYKNNNESLCTTLTGYNMTLCQNSFIKPINKSINNNICANQSLDIQSLCEYGIKTYNATKAKNITECESLNSSGYVYSCIASIAQYYNQTKYCAYINNSTDASNCVLLVNNHT